VAAHEPASRTSVWNTVDGTYRWKAFRIGEASGVGASPVKSVLALFGEPGAVRASGRERHWASV